MQPQMANAEVRPALSLLCEPRKRDITLAPPTPKRFEMAERNMNAGMQTVTAVIISSLRVRPTKKVSAILYMTSIICPMIEGKASSAIARVTGIVSNSSFSFACDLIVVYALAFLLCNSIG